MAVTVTNNAEGLGENTIPTTGNTSSSGTACSAVEIGVSSSILALTAAATFGSRGYRFTLAANSGDGATRLRWALVEPGRVVISAYLRLRSTITATEDLMGIRSSSGSMGMIVFGTDGKIRMWNAVGSGIAGSVSAGTIPTDGTPRFIQMSAQKGTTTSDGHLGWAIYDQSGNLLESWTSSAVNTGTSDSASFFVGRSTGRTAAHTYDTDEIRAGAFSSGWIDPVSATPTANAGVDQSNIEPGNSVTLDASGSNTATGSITAYAWTQINGTPVVIANPTTVMPTFIAPLTLGGDNLEFEVTVTNSAALTATDTIIVSVLRATELLRLSGTWQPRRLTSRNGSSWQ